MSKKLDSDIKALRGCVRALEDSSSITMLAANLDFICGRFRDPKVIAKWSLEHKKPFFTPSNP